MTDSNRRLGYLVLRLALGFNILLHGATRFGANYQKFIDWDAQQFAGSPLPDWSVNAFSHCVPPLEFIIGLLLVLGLATRYVAVAGSLLMMALMFGMSILQKWEIVGLQMNYVLFYFILIFLNEHNHYSLDRRFRK